MRRIILLFTDNWGLKLLALALALAVYFSIREELRPTAHKETARGTEQPKPIFTKGIYHDGSGQ